MKRLIKFYTRYTSHNDKVEFSTCSSKMEVLPYLVDDKAGPAVLMRLAKELGLRTKGQAVKVTSKGYSRSRITHAVALTSYVASESSMYKGEKYREYLAFIPCPQSDVLTPSAAIGQVLTADQAYSIVNGQELGIQEVGEHLDGKTILVKEGWEFYTDLRILGYDHEQFLKVMGAEDYGFSDDTFTCSGCQKMESNDSGHTVNYRIVGCEMLGIGCGCYDEHAASVDGLDDYAGKSDEAMELSAAKVHAEAGRIVFIERFIGGMTDPGRGGYWHGDDDSDADYAESGTVRNGRPAAILKALKAADPKGVYMFSHDDSGQFQSYFSVWKVIKGRGSKALLKKARKALTETYTDPRQ